MVPSHNNRSSHLNVECTSANRLFDTFYLKHLYGCTKNRDLWPRLVTIKTLNASGLREFGMTKILTDWKSIYITHCSLHTRQFNLISSIHSNNEAINFFTTETSIPRCPVRYLKKLGTKLLTCNRNGVIRVPSSIPNVLAVCSLLQ